MGGPYCVSIYLLKYVDLAIKINSGFFLWNSGPEGTCFEGGVFPAKLVFPPDYPLSPPKMKFTCEMFHPNSNLIWIIIVVRFNIYFQKFSSTVEFAYQFCTPQAMIQWATSYPLNDGVPYRALKKSCSALSQC